MKNFVFLFLMLAATVSFGQKTFEVQDFSKDYYGKVHLEKPAEVFSPGWIAIYEKKTDRLIIKLDAQDLDGDTFEGKIKANVLELPYGEQSLIIYDDFNFDGVKDFAIKDGQNSCYGGPSFRIYLAGKVKGRFALNKEFTRLAQDYCGMFDVDAKTKKIMTMTKSGCCWHQFSEFVVVNNAPQAVKVIEEDLMNSPFATVTTGVWNGKKMIKRTARVIDFEENGISPLLSFKTIEGGQVILFNNEGRLNYVFVNKSGNVDFAYPQDAGQENPFFALDSKENPAALVFANKNATYRVYETGNEKIGIEVEANGKISNIAGDAASRKGSLRALLTETLENLTFK
ncbi:MAG TPA: hypothetical protein VIL74_00065 [Pyrinomonadaceae bacterium]|jgi:hypothetical protein